MLHIGKLIKNKLSEQQKSVVWLAKELSCSRTNVYKILGKYSIDTELLVKISTILEHDFFQFIPKKSRKGKKQKQAKRNVKRNSVSNKYTCKHIDNTLLPRHRTIVSIFVTKLITNIIINQ